jgi:hypothetical protein
LVRRDAQKTASAWATLDHARNDRNAMGAANVPAASHDGQPDAVATRREESR